MSDPLREPVYRPGRDVSTWPYVKLQRASQHLAVLQGQIGLWVATQPFTTVGETAQDRLSWSLRLKVLSPPPVQHWAVYLGDVIHNLRSALDAAVWEMCTRDGATPRRPHEIQFPIEEDPAKWDRTVQRRLAGAPVAAIERLRIVQPMMRAPEERPQDPLLLLQHLSNLDKHRSSVEASLMPDAVNADFGIDFGSDEAADKNTPPDVRVHFPKIRDGELVVEYSTKTEILGTTGGFGLSVMVAVDTPLGAQDLFKTMGGLIQFVGQVLSVLHGGAVKDPVGPQEGDSDEGWQDLQVDVDGAQARP